MVLVSPRIWPDTTDTAPNSPMARALHSSTPYNRPHLILGRVTRKKVCKPDAPSEIAASSSCVPCSCIKGISERATNVRGPFADPLDAGAGHAGGGGGDLARRVRLADLLPRHSAQYQMGPVVWRTAVQRARHGRVRRGVCGVGPYPRRDQHHAAAGRDSLQ